jgi:hypothetical protein
MGQQFELTIDISADGRTVTGTVTGIHGHTCENVAALLDEVGREVEHKHTADWDKPEPVEIKTSGQRHQTIGGGKWGF